MAGSPGGETATPPHREQLQHKTEAQWAYPAQIQPHNVGGGHKAWWQCLAQAVISGLTFFIPHPERQTGSGHTSAVNIALGI